MSVPVVKVMLQPEPVESKRVSAGLQCPFHVYYVAADGFEHRYESCETLAAANESATRVSGLGKQGVRIIDLSNIPPVEY